MHRENTLEMSAQAIVVHHLQKGQTHLHMDEQNRNFITLKTITVSRDIAYIYNYLHYW